MPQVCSVSQDWRRCFACKTHGHIARYCPYGRRQGTLSGLPSEKLPKSAKRRERDNARMSAYNAQKASVANMPFASVANDELKKLLPTPDHGRDSAKQVNAYKNAEELTSRLAETEKQRNELASRVADSENQRNELESRVAETEIQRNELASKLLECESQIDSLDFDVKKTSRREN